jgi:excisionase family DNA binding protein
MATREHTERHRATTAPMLVTVRAAAKILALGESTVYGLVASGELPFVRVGRAKRLAVRDLEQWIERSRVHN